MSEEQEHRANARAWDRHQAREAQENTARAEARERVRIAQEHEKQHRERRRAHARTPVAQRRAPLDTRSAADLPAAQPPDTVGGLSGRTGGAWFVGLSRLRGRRFGDVPHHRARRLGLPSPRFRAARLHPDASRASRGCTGACVRGCRMASGATGQELTAARPPQPSAHGRATRPARARSSLQWALLDGRRHEGSSCQAGADRARGQETGPTYAARTAARPCGSPHPQQPCGGY